MKIADLIQPKWKHKNPEIRLREIRENEAIPMEELKQIAETDPLTSVRMEAVQRIDDLEALHLLLSSSNETVVLNAVKDRLFNIYMDDFNNTDTSDPSETKRIFSISKDEGILADVAIAANDPEIRQTIVEYIESPALLCKIAENACGLKAGMAVVEKISDEALLKRLARRASNKKIRKRAQEKLDAGTKGESTSLFDDSSEIRTERMEKRDSIRSELIDICERVEQIAEKIPDGAEHMVADANFAWEKVLEKNDAGLVNENEVNELEIRFDQACALFMKNRKYQVLTKEKNEETICSLSECCDHVEQLVREDDLENIRTVLEKETEKWKTLCRELESENFEAVKTRFDEAVRKAEERMHEISRVSDEKDREEENRLLELIKIVEEAVEEKERKGLTRKVKKAQKEWKRTGARIPDIKAGLEESFRNACDRFFRKQKEYWEIRDWELWSNLNLKEELCDLVDLLLKKENLAGVPASLRQLMNRWKEIGPVERSKSDEIWSRFRSTCDLVYEKCLERKKQLLNEATAVADRPDEKINWKESAKKIRIIQEEWFAIGFLSRSMENEIRDAFQHLCDEFFQRQRAFFKTLHRTREENLKNKIELCRMAEELSESTEWNETSGKLKELQKKWKEIGPVPKKHSDEVWKRFRKACDLFFLRLKEEKPANLKKKEALCAKAEELKNAVNENNVETLTRQVHNLRKEWKSVGPVPREVTNSLWKKFQSSCDRFFELRTEIIEKRDARMREHAEKKEIITTEAEALAESTDWNTTAEKLKALQKEWKEIGPSNRIKEQELWKRFRSACDFFFSNRKKYFTNTENQKKEHISRKEELCLTLEVLAAVAIPEKKIGFGGKSDAAEQLKMALQLKDEILIPGNRKGTWDKVHEKIKRISDEWKKIPAVIPTKKEEELRKRYKRALMPFFSNSRNTRTNGLEKLFE